MRSLLSKGIFGEHFNLVFGRHNWDFHYFSHPTYSVVEINSWVETEYLTNLLIYWLLANWLKSPIWRADKLSENLEAIHWNILHL